HNNTISFSYGRESLTLGEICFHVQGTVDHDIWPSTITWGANTTTGATDHYQVTFVSNPRTVDTNFEHHDNQYAGGNDGPHETRQLDAIQVQSYVNGTWQLVRQYNLGHTFTLTSDHLVCSGSTCNDNTAAKLALTSITRVGNDGSTLPTTNFTYGAF